MFPLECLESDSLEATEPRLDAMILKVNFKILLWPLSVAWHGSSPAGISFVTVVGRSDGASFWLQTFSFDWAPLTEVLTCRSHVVVSDKRFINLVLRVVLLGFINLHDLLQFVLLHNRGVFPVIFSISSQIPYSVILITYFQSGGPCHFSSVSGSAFLSDLSSCFWNILWRCSSFIPSWRLSQEVCHFRLRSNQLVFAFSNSSIFCFNQLVSLLGHCGPLLLLTVQIYILIVNLGLE